MPQLSKRLGRGGDLLNAPVPPYQHNPSAWPQRIPICVLAMVAAAISTHLALYQWGLIETVWDPFFGDGSNKVITSKAAKQMYAWLGIHDAALGVLAYLGDAILGFAGSTRRWQYRPWLVILFGIDVIPLGIVSVVLVMLQFLVVGYWCTLCLVTAAISLILVYWAWDEVRVSLTYLYRVWAIDHDKRLLWDAFWGRYGERQAEVARDMINQEDA